MVDNDDMSVPQATIVILVVIREAISECTIQEAGRGLPPTALSVSLNAAPDHTDYLSPFAC